MITWPEVEAALQGRPGWRRVGREYHGPCPVTGAGKDGAWFGAGSGSGGVRCGCRHCGDAGGRLDGEALRAHLAAVAGDGAGAVETPAGSRPRAASTGWLSSDGTQRRPGGGAGDRAAAVWRAGVEADGTPGAVYLRGRGAWPGPVAALRWLPAVEAARIGLRPRLPDGAAGALLYRFAAPGEVDTAAVQCEAVNEGGERMAFSGGVGKRPSVTGSDFDDGRRVFVARSGGAEGGGVNLAEGPIDALAAATLAAAGIERRALGDRPIVAAAGAGGWRSAAVADWPGPVTLWVQADWPGYRAALRLEAALRHGGRAVGLEVAPAGMDWGDVAYIEAAEREAVQSGD